MLGSIDCLLVLGSPHDADWDNRGPWLALHLSTRDREGGRLPQTLCSKGWPVPAGGAAHRDSHELRDLAPVTVGEDAWVVPHGVLADTPAGCNRHPRGCPRRIPSRGGANAEFVVIAGGHQSRGVPVGSVPQVQVLEVVGSRVRSWGAVSGQCAEKGRRCLLRAVTGEASTTRCRVAPHVLVLFYMNYAPPAVELCSPRRSPPKVLCLPRSVFTCLFVVRRDARSS